MEVVRTSETSVYTTETTRRYTPGGSILVFSLFTISHISTWNKDFYFRDIVSVWQHMTQSIKCRILSLLWNRCSVDWFPFRPFRRPASFQVSETVDNIEAHNAIRTKLKWFRIARMNGNVTRSRVNKQVTSTGKIYDIYLEGTGFVYLSRQQIFFLRNFLHQFYRIPVKWLKTS
jgi:hypothetical protein